MLIIPSWYFPPGTHEIAGIMFHHMAGSLRDQGLDARILFADFNKDQPFVRKHQWTPEEGVPTWRTQHWFPPKINTILYSLWVQRYVAEIKKYIRSQGRPDLIHAQSYQAASVCATLFEETGIPFVYAERYSGFITNSIHKHHLPFIKRAIDGAAVLTCVSPGLASRIQPHTSKTIRILPNFFDSTVFYPDAAVVKSNVFTWVSVGEPAHIKGLDILLKAYAALRRRLHDVPMRLVMIDRIPEQEQLVQQAQALGIAEEITWTGLLSQKEVADILRQSHVLVSASRTETFGKAILEALACGLPVVATRTDGAEYILSSSRQGELAEPGSPESLLRAMGTVFAGYSTYDADTIHSEVKKRFGQKEVIRQWVQLYKSIGHDHGA